MSFNLINFLCRLFNRRFNHNSLQSRQKPVKFYKFTIVQKYTFLRAFSTIDFSLTIYIPLWCCQVCEVMWVSNNCNLFWIFLLLFHLLHKWNKLSWALVHVLCRLEPRWENFWDYTKTTQVYWHISVFQCCLSFFIQVFDKPVCFLYFHVRNIKTLGEFRTPFF